MSSDQTAPKEHLQLLDCLEEQSCSLRKLQSGMNVALFSSVQSTIQEYILKETDSLTREVDNLIRAVFDDIFTDDSNIADLQSSVDELCGKVKQIPRKIDVCRGYVSPRIALIFAE